MFEKMYLKDIQYICAETRRQKRCDNCPIRMLCVSCFVGIPAGWDFEKLSIAQRAVSEREEAVHG